MKGFILELGCIKQRKQYIILSATKLEKEKVDLNTYCMLWNFQQQNERTSQFIFPCNTPNQLELATRMIFPFEKAVL